MLTASRWLNGGAPRTCYRCQEQFNGSAFRGHTGMYYCSPDCRKWNDDEMTAEDAARMQ